jgi:tripartite-type tricarboxylate transporter receptor subunit TctC
MGSGGNGSPAHVIGEYFKLMTGTDLTACPYRGAAPAVTDLLGGQIQVAFTEMATSLATCQVRQAARIGGDDSRAHRGAAGRSDLSEFIPGFEASQWVGLVAPKDRRAAIIGDAQPRDQRWPRRSEDEGAASPTSAEWCSRARPADFGELIRDETEKWAKVIRAANIKVGG